MGFENFEKRPVVEPEVIEAQRKEALGRASMSVQDLNSIAVRKEGADTAITATVNGHHAEVNARENGTNFPDYSGTVDGRELDAKNAHDTHRLLRNWADERDRINEKAKSATMEYVDMPIESPDQWGHATEILGMSRKE